MRQVLSYLPGLIAILVCAGLGSLLSDALVALLGWRGGWAAFATLALSMLLAFGLWVLGVFLLNSLRKTKSDTK